MGWWDGSDGWVGGMGGWDGKMDVEMDGWEDGVTELFAWVGVTVLGCERRPCFASKILLRLPDHLIT